jgi:hypothetical protein
MRASEVRRIALSLPYTCERRTWDAATFRTKDKIFVIISPDGKHATVKSGREQQHAIVGSDPKTFSVAEYVGRHGWVTVRLAGVASRAMRVLIIDSWRRVAPKRMVATYDADAKTRMSLR